METIDRHQENRLRRMARRKGYQLKKPRYQNPNGWYLIVDPYYNNIIVYDIGLNEVERTLGELCPGLLAAGSSET